MRRRGTGCSFRSLLRFICASTVWAYSLVVQALLATVLLLTLGQFQKLFELAVFSEWLFYMLTATTVFIYRRRHPEMARPYRVWGYPVLPAVFVLSAAVVLYSSFVGNLQGSLIGTGLILLGLPLYEWIRVRYAQPAIKA